MENPELFRLLAKIIIQLISGPLKEHPNREFYFISQSIFGDFSSFVQTTTEKNYPWAYIKKLVELHIESNIYSPCISFSELQELFPYETINDSQLEEICTKVLERESKSVMDYKKGKLSSLNHLKGQVMKESKGKSNISKVEEILKQKLNANP